MTHKTQPTAHAEITATISADLRRIDDAGAKSAPITFMTEDRACTWAWDQVQQDVGTKGWTAGDSCNFYGFFLWGWNYRGQYEVQRTAAQPSRECLQHSAVARDPAVEKPGAGRYVLAWMEGRAVPIRAMWVPAKWLEADDECPEDWAEYDEAKDQYFCPEGWYEKNEHEEKNWSVSTPVVAWMELPRLDVSLQAAPPEPAGVAVPDELQRLAQFLLNMQTRLGSCREACGDEYSMKAWDDYSRAAALLAAAPAQAVDRRTPPDMLVNGGALKLALNVLRRAGKNEVADELEKTAAPAQEHATQLAGQGQDLIGMAETWEQSADDAEACKSERSQPDYNEGLVAGMRQCAADLRAAAPAQAQEDARDAQIAKLSTAYTELSNMFHDQIVAQQAAWIEWQHGQGAEAAMGWIENGLCGPGHIPDEDDPYGKEAQAWYDANNSDPFPVCQCGRPSNIMWMGMGFCCKVHHDAARAAQGGAA